MRTSKVLVVLGLFILFFNSFASDNILLWPVEVNGKWGYINGGRYFQIKPQFDSAGYFYNPVSAPVWINGKTSWIDVHGKLVVPADFDYVGSGGSLIPVRKGRQWGVWKNNERTSRYGPFLELPDVDSIGISVANFVPVLQHGKWGLLNDEGKAVVLPIYEELRTVRCSLGEKGNHLTGYYLSGYTVKLNGKWGIIYPPDSVCVPFKYDSLQSGYLQLIGARLNNRWGFIDYADSLWVPFQYDSVRIFRRQPHDYGFGQEDAAISVDGKWNFINMQGTNQLPESYEAVGCVGKEGIAVRITDKWGYVNRKGEMTIPARYDSAGCMEGYACVKVGNLYGFIDNHGNEIFAPQFDSVRNMHSLRLGPVTSNIVTKDGKFGFVFPGTRKDVIGWFEAVHPFYLGFAYVKQYGKWRYIDKDGKTFWPKEEK